MATSTIADQLSLLAAACPRPTTCDGDAFRLHHHDPLHTRAALAAELGRVLDRAGGSGSWVHPQPRSRLARLLMAVVPAVPL